MNKEKDNLKQIMMKDYVIISLLGLYALTSIGALVWAMV